MMKLFKREKAGTVERGSDKMAAALAAWLERLQCRWAAWMNRWFNRMGRRGKLACYYTMLVLGLGTSIHSLMEVGHKPRASGIKPPAIRSPVREPTGPEPRISGRELCDFRRFSLLMDSLGKTPEGTRIRDSILRLHPGLQDSILQVRQLYNLEF